MILANMYDSNKWGTQTSLCVSADMNMSLRINKVHLQIVLLLMIVTRVDNIHHGIVLFLHDWFGCFTILKWYLFWWWFSIDCLYFMCRNIMLYSCYRKILLRTDGMKFAYTVVHSDLVEETWRRGVGWNKRKRWMRDKKHV